MAYFLIHQSDDPDPFACWSLCFLILMPIIQIEISSILIVYSNASVIRTPTTRTLHLPEEFCREPIYSMLFCTINPEFQDPDPDRRFLRQTLILHFEMSQ